jgi:hypothetical protein
LVREARVEHHTSSGSEAEAGSTRETRLAGEFTMPVHRNGPCLVESLESRRLFSVILGNVNGDASGDGSDTAIDQPLDNASGGVGGDTSTTDGNGDRVQVIYYGGINKHGGHKGSHHAGHSSQSFQQSGGGIWTGLTVARNRR